MWSSVDPDVNLAAGKDVTCSPACSYFSGGAFVHSAQYLVDEALDSGILHTCYEGSLESRGGLEAGACDPAIPKSVEIDLGQEYLIDGMLIVNLLSPPTDLCCRQRAEDLMVDFMDADRNVKLTTAKITSANHSNDAFIMDVRTGIQLDGNGEFDAWRYSPRVASACPVRSTGRTTRPGAHQRVLGWTGLRDVPLRPTEALEARDDDDVHDEQCDNLVQHG